MKKHILNLMLALLFALVTAGMIPDSMPGKDIIVALVTVAAFATSFIPAQRGALYQTPAAFAGSMTQTFVSAQGINQRVFYQTLIRKYGDQGMEFLGTLHAMGWIRNLGAQFIEHWEDDWIYDNFKVLAQGGGGTTATLTIDPTSINSTTNTFFPGKKDIIEFPNKDAFGNYIQAYVTNIGANTIDVQIVKPSLGWTIPATTNGQALFVPTNASGERTGQPAPKVTTYNLVQNKYGTVKTSVEVSGSEMTDPYWFDEYMGKKGVYAITLETLQLDFRQLVAEQGMFLSGFQYENLTDSGQPVSGTEGLLPTMNRVSIQMPYTTWGVANFDIINKALSKVYAGYSTGSMLALDLYTTTQHTLQDYFKNTAIDYVTKTTNEYLFGSDGTGSDLAANVDFQYLQMSKRKYAFKMLETFNNPTLYGTTGYDYTRRGLMFPLRHENQDPKTKATLPQMCCVYREGNGYKRLKEMFWTGSANVAQYGNTDDIDTRILNCRTELGAEFFASNQFINIKPS